MNIKLTIYIFILLSCVGNSQKTDISNKNIDKELVIASALMDDYVPQLVDKQVALVVNQTSTIGEIHLVDTLLAVGINIKHIFSPEHGFRGRADAGEKIEDGIDMKTKLPIISLYGKNKKATQDQLSGIDVVVFDIQDVGVRFYTYISTLHYVMEACAENDIKLIVLDRPNPNGHYIDGPVLKEGFESFIGMHPVPVVYGMTIGEYALMINGELWLSSKERCKLEVIKSLNYNHNLFYELPIKPSPNLPNARSISLYPSLCFFEGTALSVGRGTDLQFQQVGHPQLNQYDYHFTPIPNEGAKHPKHENKICFGRDYSMKGSPDSLRMTKLDLSTLLNFKQDCLDKKINFFTRPDFFDLLAGSDALRKQIIEAKSEKEIRASWQADLQKFKITRERYLLYP